MSTSTDFELDGTRGRIVGHRWGDDGDATFAVLIAHGFGEHAGRYEHVAARLVAEGAVVYAPDHANHGRSEGEYGLVDDIENVQVPDLGKVAGLLPDLPLLLIGHSMGGIIATRAVQTGAVAADALVLSGPAIGGNPGFEQLLALPDPLPEVPIDPAALSRDPSVGEAYMNDPLVYHGSFTRPSLLGLFASIEAIAQGPKLEIPTLHIHGELDQLAPLEITKAALDHIRPESLEQKIYPGAQHEIFNETNKEDVIDDVVQFASTVFATANK